MDLFNVNQKPELGALAKNLAESITSKSAVIGVVGLGYVGLPIALEYAKNGFKVLGVDVDSRKVNDLQAGRNYIEDLDDAEIAEVVKKGLLAASTDFAVLAGANVIFIAVPTPFNENKEPDISYILNSGFETSKSLQPGQLVILKSTTFPGTTEDYLRPQLEKSGLVAGKDFFLAFSPERVDPGNKVYHTGNTPIVIGGIDKESTYLAALANKQIIENIWLVSNPKIAELEKLLENIFRSVNIALVNEIAMLCERMPGIDVWEVIEAASTKPFGYMKFTPGPGIGGHCIPIDPYYLSWLARAYDFETRFITLSANVNESMPYHVVNMVLQQVAHQPIALKDAKILILGVAFKKNVKDLRHSPAEPIMRLLKNAGVKELDYTDPWVPEYQVDKMTFRSVDLTPEKLQSYNVVVVVTDHDLFDVEMIHKNSRSIVDTRNVTSGIREGRENIRLLGSNI
ncbi:MAG: nucleotide sugar dehydrogenase [Bacteroidia bacterium]|nr:nucleotide sugar dehydrogenase [Bacteroidia bacterium]